LESSDPQKLIEPPYSQPVSSYNHKPGSSENETL